MMKRQVRLHRRWIVWIVLVAALAWGVPAWAQEGTETPPDLVQAARLYEENCEVCHGPRGQGRVGATLNEAFAAIQPDVAVREAIANGVPGSFMPPWSQENGGPLTGVEIDALVDYVLSLQSGEPPVAAPAPTNTARPLITPVPEVEGDPNEGAVLYDENCAMCHGANGQGRVGATLSQDWPSIRPDIAVKSAIENGVPGSFMPPWSEEEGGPLSEGQINDLVAFVLSWSAEPPAPSPTIPVVTEAPEIPVQGGNTGLIVGAVILVLIVVGGVAWMTLRE